MIVGFIGVGRMGLPMAGHLLDAGHDLVVHDVRRAVAEPLLERGAVLADSPRVVAEAADIVITIVPSSRDVEAVVAGLLPALGSRHLLVEMTTSDPSVTRRLAAQVTARGARIIDAPVSGGVKGAVEGTLAIMGGARPPTSSARARCWSAWASGSSTWAPSPPDTR